RLEASASRLAQGEKESASSGSYGGGVLPRKALGPDPLLDVDREVAGVGMASPAVDQGRDLLVAGIEAMRAARMERAALRNPDQRRRRTLDRLQALTLVVDAGYR